MPIPSYIADEFYGKPHPGLVQVFVGPWSVKHFEGERIPLDGRLYICDGKLILKNGIEVRAKFYVDTTTFDFLRRETVICYYKEQWYRWDEPEFLEALGLTRDEAFPFTWLPDRPLDYSEKGPYPMEWKSK